MKSNDVQKSPLKANKKSQALSFWVKDENSALSNHFERLTSRTYSEQEIEEIIRAFDNDLSSNTMRPMIVDLLQATSTFLHATTLDPLFKKERDNDIDGKRMRAVFDTIDNTFKKASNDHEANNQNDAAAIFKTAIDYCQACVDHRKQLISTNDKTAINTSSIK